MFDSDGYICILHQKHSYFLENINTICSEIYWLISQANRFGNQRLFTKNQGKQQYRCVQHGFSTSVGRSIEGGVAFLKIHRFENRNRSALYNLER